MTKYNRVPQVVEAHQWQYQPEPAEGEEDTRTPLPKWVAKAIGDGSITVVKKGRTVLVEGEHGSQRAEEGDWIVQPTEGFMTVMLDAVFCKNYTPAKD